MNKRWKILLTDAKSLVMFTDLLMPYVYDLKQMPVPITNVLLNYIEDVITEKEIVENAEREVAICYFILGVLLGNINMNMYMNEKHMDDLVDISKNISEIFFYLENYMVGNFDAEFKEETWEFILNETGEKAIIAIKGDDKLDSDKAESS
jgi:hypothetical protein